MQAAQIALRKTLLTSFTRAKVRNPAYSMRAFARKLQLSPAALSEILNDKRRVSAKLAQRILTNLNMPPRDAKEILALFADKPGTRLAQRRVAEGANAQVPELSLEYFRAVAEWHHFAILSLMETKDFRCDARWISRRLGITQKEVTCAVERLERLGLLAKGTEGELVQTGAQMLSSDKNVLLAFRRAHVQNFELAKEALERVEWGERDFTSLTLAVDVARLPAAKAMVREFRENLAKLLESSPERTEVFQLNVQLFPLSRDMPLALREKEPSASAPTELAFVNEPLRAEA